ncbi:MAG: sensor histidine kinase [Deltaproteobacteria bacterium]|nr:MAG: sensor histidine kinase [Deltaproteobacteria bacterium]
MPTAHWPSPDAENARQRLNLYWLVRLRWLAVLGQVTVVAVVGLGMGVSLPAMYLLSLTGYIALTNAVLQGGLRLMRDRVFSSGFSRRVTWTIAAVVAFDVLMLTGLLYGSGGRDNPFAIFYLVHVVLGAVLLPARLAWGVTLLCVLGYAAVFHVYVPLPELGHGHPPGAGPTRLQHDMNLHVNGMFVAIALASVVLVTFVSRLSLALRQQDRNLSRLRDREALTQHAHALAAFAAGAAHELGSPLTSIAITARELEREAARLGEEEFSEDASVIRQEVERCRRILSRIALDAGTRLGEEPSVLTVEPWLREVVADLPEADRVRLDLAPAARAARISGPIIALGDALRSVLRNALQASPRGESVDVRARREGPHVILDVVDRGHGMAPDTLARADEPFFTTRGGADGFGLGLYLTRMLLQDMGGRFELSSTQGEGTTVRLVLPCLDDDVAAAPPETRSTPPQTPGDP